MYENFLKESKFVNFEASIAQKVRNSNSLNEIEFWLNSQQFIDFVRLEEYVVKTFPPRREFTIGVRMEEGIIREKVLTVVMLKGDQFEFYEIR